MSKMIRQTSFTAGEADETTWKRSDIPEYLTAAQSLLNVEVGTTGLAKKRKGTVFGYMATNQAIFNSTMYEFVDKNGNYYIVLGSNRNFFILTTPENETAVITSSGSYVITYLDTQVVYEDLTMDLVHSIPVDYTGADLFSIDYSQDNDSLILTSPNFPPGRIYISNYDPLTFSFEYLDIYPLPAYDFSQINYNKTTVTLSVVGSVLTITFSGLPPGPLVPVYNNAWIGGQIIGGGVSEFAPVGYAIITAVNQVGLNVTFTATVQIAFETTAGKYATAGSQYSIRQPAWVNVPNNPYGLGYPSKVLYFQNRLWFGNTALLPTTIFGSKLNQPISFDVGTGKDTDAIIYTIGQTSSGEILWLNGGKQLEIYTTNFEFACPQNDDTGLTPSTFSIRQQSSYGSSTTLKPQTYLNDSYFVQKTGKSAVNFHFTGVGLAYQSTNIAPQSQHLMKNPINRALLQGTDVSQDNFIYLLNNSDDTLTAFQFANEIKLAALTPVEFKNATIAVQLIDICTVNNQVYILKYYELTEQFIIERFQTGVYVDSMESYLMQANGLVEQLDRLNDYYVQVIYKNQDFGQYRVINGDITVNNPDQITDMVQIGLLYNVEIKPMYPFFSATSAPFKKNISRIYIDYYKSLNFLINGKLVQYQNFHEIQLGMPLIPKTGTAIFSPVSGYERFDPESIVITQASPFDLQILSIGYEIDMSVI